MRRRVSFVGLRPPQDDSALRPLSHHEADVSGGEVGQVREDQRQIGAGDAKPGGQSCAELVGGIGGNPAAVAGGVVGTAQRKLGHAAVDVAASDGAADGHLVTAPAVVAACAGRGLERAAEFGNGEAGDFVRDAELDGGVVESLQSGIEQDEERVLVGNLVGVVSKPPIEQKKIWRLRLSAERT